MGDMRGDKVERYEYDRRVERMEDAMGKMVDAMGEMRGSIGTVTGSVKTLVAVGIAFVAVGTAAVGGAYGGGFWATINLYEKIGAVEKSVAHLASVVRPESVVRREAELTHANVAIEAWDSPQTQTDLKHDGVGWRGREGAL